MDLSKQSLDELKKLKKDVEKAIASFEARKRKEALKAVEQVAREYGVELSDIFGAGGNRKSTTAKAKGTPKFRNPADPSQTWSGRGRQPAWYKAAIAAGKSNDDLAL
jgi:DNA-binding protein H-NS